MTSPNPQLQAVVNHVLLPPNLPGSVEQNPHQINLDLIARLQRACEELRQSTNSLFGSELEHLGRSLRNCRLIHSSHCLDSHALEDAFQNLEEGGIIIIHVVEQNAGILVRRGLRELPNRVIFEAFEVSARSADVLKSKDALQWDFPTSAAAIPSVVFEDRAFQRRLANFLERPSAESIKEFGAFSKKARSNVYEPRDTTDPALITSLLIRLLEGIGEQLDVTPIRKRVREEVRWKDSVLPWRRSPFWLLLRVETLRNLTASSNPDVAQALYKIMMCIVHAHLLSELVGSSNPETSHLLLTKLCRRLAKVEHDKSIAGRDSKLSKLYTVLLGNVRFNFLQHTTEARRALWSVWNSYKQRISRTIHPMRDRLARPANFNISFKNSLRYFETLREPVRQSTAMDTYVMPTKYREFYQHHYALTKIEPQEADRQSDVPSDITTCENSLIQLSGHIQAYISTSADSYAIGTVERSHMILAVIWMWMIMDKSLNRLFPALYHFNPVFQPSTIDCLRLCKTSYLGFWNCSNISTSVIWAQLVIGLSSTIPPMVVLQRNTTTTCQVTPSCIKFFRRLKQKPVLQFK